MKFVFLITITIKQNNIIIIVYTYIITKAYALRKITIRANYIKNIIPIYV